MRNINADLSSRISALDDFFGQYPALNRNFGHSHHEPGHGHHQPTDEGLQFRTVDGTQNNLAQPDLNSAGTDFARIGPADFVNNDGHTPILDATGPQPERHQQHRGHW